MAAQSRAYAPDLVDYLDGLAARASNTLYGPRRGRLPAVWDVVVRSFPATLRRRWKFFVLSSALFGLPLLIGVLGTLQWDGFAERVLPSGQLAVMAEMYSDGYDAGRDEAIDTMMFGHYVHNNIGIAFRCFATGILLGLGSIYFLVYNGLVIGTTVGYVMKAGYGSNILTFICGHGVFELTAIVVSGGAGLQMGWALVETHGRTRLGSLRAQAKDLVALVAGAAVMLAIAAVLEGFWSPSSIPAPIKWAAAGVFAVLLLAFLLFGGRDRLEPVEARWT
jgi:uncharacterized membrane protein SpoIIM required for sporulation